MRGNITGEWTQRPLLKIIMSIKNRIIERIGQNIGPQYEQDIADALAGGEVEEKLMEMVQNEQVDLVDANNNLLIQQQRSALEENDALESPKARHLEAAELKIKDK